MGVHIRLIDLKFDSLVTYLHTLSEIFDHAEGRDVKFLVYFFPFFYLLKYAIELGSIV